MGAALRSEVTKLLSTRLWWVLALVMFGYVALIGGFLAFSFTLDGGSPASSGKETAELVYGLVNPLCYAFPLVAGSLLMTGEYRHRTISQTLLATPNRTVVLLAKLAVSVALGVAYGLAGSAGIVLGGAPILAARGDGAYLGESSVLQVLVLSALAMALWSVIGTAFGAVLTNQVAVIVGILAFTQLLEPIARLAFSAIDGLGQVGQFLPGAAADGLVGSSFLGADDLLPRAAAAAVLVGYAVLFAVIGRLTTLRRDIT